LTSANKKLKPRSSSRIATAKPLRKNRQLKKHMKLLTKEIRASLPSLGEQKSAADPIAHVKFFTPDGGWTWYAAEGSQDGDEFLFFGYVVGVEAEWGYFSLSELESIRGALGLPVERDLYFTPAPMSTFIQPADRSA
jgi:hypothetical protein